RGGGGSDAERDLLDVGRERREGASLAAVAGHAPDGVAREDVSPGPEAALPAEGGQRLPQRGAEDGERLAGLGLVAQRPDEEAHDLGAVVRERARDRLGEEPGLAQAAQLGVSDQ